VEPGLQQRYKNSILKPIKVKEALESRQNRVKKPKLCWRNPLKVKGHVRASALIK
jgi:hypothetical protein